MTEERATYKLETTGKPVKAVRLENFRDEAWQGPLGHRIFPRYPGARIVLRRPFVVVVELRTSSAWSQDDEEFFAAMWREGYVQRWEPLSELPPLPKPNATVYANIGYRIGSNERLTLAQSAALLSQLHDLEERAISAEEKARELRLRAIHAEDCTTQTATTYNDLIEMLNTELSLAVSGDGDGWLAQDASTGKIIARGTMLADVYRAALALRLREKEQPQGQVKNDDWPDHRAVLERLARETEEDNE